MLFAFPNTITEPLDFRPILKNEEKGEKFAESASLARQRVCDALVSQASSMALIDAIEAYLPHLLRLLKLVDENPSLDEKFKIKWRSVLSMGIRTSLTADIIEKPIVKCYSLYFDAIYALLAHGFALCNMAKNCWPGSTESSANEAVDLLCRASGVFSTAAIEFAPRWKKPPKDRPPECSSTLLLALSQLCVADAQRIVLAKAERRAMSPSNILRLEVDCINKYQVCAATLEQLTSRDAEELAATFAAYVVDGLKMLRASALQRLGTSMAEGGENGVAVACFTAAYNELLDVKNSAYPPFKKISPERLLAVDAQRINLVRVNNNVTFQKVPSLEEALAMLPAGRSMVESKPYTLPPMLEPELGGKSQ